MFRITPISPAEGIMAGTLIESVAETKKVSKLFVLTLKLVINTIIIIHQYHYLLQTTKLWCVLKDDMFQYWKVPKRDEAPLGTLMMYKVYEIIRYGTAKDFQVTPT